MQDGLGDSSTSPLFTPTSAKSKTTVQPSNFVSIYNADDEDITGVWTINPELPLKASSLANTSKPWNLDLSVRGLGSINATVYMAPSSRFSNTNRKGQWSMMHLQSDNSVCFNLQETSLGVIRRPFYLVVSGGPISISLPRSFRGPVKVHLINQSVEFSPEVEANLSPTSALTEEGVRFLGNFSSDPPEWQGKSFKDWQGDKLSAVVRGGAMLKIQYEPFESGINERSLDQTQPTDGITVVEVQDGKDSEETRFQDGRADSDIQLQGASGSDGSRSQDRQGSTQGRAFKLRRRIRRKQSGELRVSDRECTCM